MVLQYFYLKRREFARYSKVFPLSQTLEFKIPSKWYRRTVGGLEVLCGFCLTFIPSKRIKQAANLILVVMMMFATYNHWMVGDKFERIAPSLVFFFMLTCRLIVEYQTKRKEKTDKQAVDKAAAGKAANANASGPNAENSAVANNSNASVANNVSANDAKSKKED